MAAIGDIVEVVLTGELLGQKVQNRFTYRIDDIIGTGATAFMNDALRSIFNSSVVTPLLEAIHPDYTATQIDVRNLNDQAGDLTTSITRPGESTLGGDVMPSFVSASIQLRPIEKTIRHGRKAVPGVPEVGFTGNDISPSYATALSTATAPFAAILNHANGQFVPVISRILPAQVRPFVPFAVPILESLLRGVGSQYSRKAGRGS